MLKKISIVIFWLAFFGFFFLMLIPKYKYLTNATLQHWGSNTTFDNSIFALHIFAGIIVYCTAILQFTPAIRNKYISFHRITGKLYILSSLLCIISLYIMLPRTGCTACMPSQFTVTSLWLLFILLAYYFIKQRKIVLHQRMMISSFICAAYFVTIRVVDAFAMDAFRYLFPNESTAFLASDVFVWLVPLLLFNMYWLLRDKKNKLDKSVFYVSYRIRISLIRKNGFENQLCEVSLLRSCKQTVSNCFIHCPANTTPVEKE